MQLGAAGNLGEFHQNQPRVPSNSLDAASASPCGCMSNPLKSGMTIGMHAMAPFYSNQLKDEVLLTGTIVASSQNDPKTSDACQSN